MDCQIGDELENWSRTDIGMADWALDSHQIGTGLESDWDGLEFD